MKKEVILYSIFAVVVFLERWFWSEIYNILTPFLLPFIELGIFIVYIVLFVYAIVLVIKKFKQFKWKTLIPFLVMLILAMIVIFFPFATAKLHTEFSLYKTQREKVVEMVKEKKLQDDGIGNMELPSGYKHLSCDGSVYIEEQNENSLIVGFWIFRGLMMNSANMIYYTSQDDENTIRQAYEGEVVEITKLAPNWYYAVID